MSDDPQLDLYRNAPQRYASIADQIDIIMALGERDCTGTGCDEGQACPRHARRVEVAERYLRLKARDIELRAATVAPEALKALIADEPGFEHDRDTRESA